MTAKKTVIKGRPRAGPVLGVVLGVGFALAMTAIVTADPWLLAGEEFTAGEPAPATVRAPLFNGLRDDTTGLVSRGGVIVARGETVTRSQAQLVFALHRSQPDALTSWLAYGAAFFVLALLYTTYLRRTHRGKLLRVQAVTLGLIVGVSLCMKILLLTTSLSVLAVPVAGAAIVAALATDLFAGIATALVAAFAIGLLTPFDPGVVTVLGVQGIAAVLAMGDGRRRWQIAAAGVIGAIGAALTYVVFFYLSWHETPVAELDSPMRSGWLAAGAGGLASIAAALVAFPVYQWLLGEITKSRLVELADLSNPLLKQIAEKSPGTWQHSLAMANMAEVAAGAIGANARLVRVGALYHDLGKSLQPTYFIENLAGQTSPHDSLTPEVSCDAIFAHVTEGVRVGRREGLPERVIDFMHMHHGDGLLEYFWAKCQEQGNPNQLTAEDFRYPGVRPQSRETAILAICDAVEAASRTLKNPDARSIEALVQRIVYGKLHLGQLDESGMSMSDLRKVSNSLMETIRHAHHVRIEYPWQREEREAAKRREAGERTTSPERPAAAVPVRPEGRGMTARIYAEPPLDSLDLPRPFWRERAGEDKATTLATAATERVSSEQDIVKRADTEPEVMEEEAPNATVSLKPALIVEDADGPDERDEPTATESATATEAATEAATATATEAATATATEAATATATEAEAEAATEPEPESDPESDSSTSTSTSTEPESEPEPEPPRPIGAMTLPGHSVAPDAQPDAHARPTTPVGIPTPVAPDTSSPRPKSRSGPPGPPPQSGRHRRSKSTIELLKGDGTAADDHAPLHTESHRAQSEDGLLAPGMMVLGPPPATLTRRASTRTDTEHHDHTLDRDDDAATPPPPRNGKSSSKAEDDNED